MIEILSASYTRHFKPFNSNIRPNIPYYLFRFQHEGQCNTLVAEGMKIIKPGDLLICKPGDPYELFVGKGMPDSPSDKCISSDYYLFCRGIWVDEWWASAKRKQITSIPFDEGMLSIWKLIIAELRVNDTPGDISLLLLQTLCMSIDRILHGLGTDSKSSGNSLAAFQIKSFIEQNANATFKLTDIANSVDLSISRIVQLFKQTYNQTITEYANQIRLAKACERMHYSTTNLEDIAESVGFQSYTYFHRVFRTQYGKTPKQYRNQYYN